ncbi:zinc finger protein 568-like [Galendromus occidentalis]|uniref:Zinc finger protein 568-like n=1 Tax=Galendromus occidentalis TaxID=34638 RepID=A0AAJ6QNZ2_9ACAR|nr:zinc finger protein 568-like [Galendromus occidentalis]
MPVPKMNALFQRGKDVRSHQNPRPVILKELLFSVDQEVLRNLGILQPLQNYAFTPAEIALWNVATQETNNNFTNDGNCGRIGKPGRKAVRDPNKPFQCNVCEYSSKSKSNFTIHMRIHTGEKPFACSECDYRTSQKGNLRIHKERRHGITRDLRLSLPATLSDSDLKMQP